MLRYLLGAEMYHTVHGHQLEDFLHQKRAGRVAVIVAVAAAATAAYVAVACEAAAAVVPVAVAFVKENPVKSSGSTKFISG